MGTRKPKRETRKPMPAETNHARLVTDAEILDAITVGEDGSTTQEITGRLGDRVTHSAIYQRLKRLQGLGQIRHNARGRASTWVRLAEETAGSSRLAPEAEEPSQSVPSQSTERAPRPPEMAPPPVATAGPSQSTSALEELLDRPVRIGLVDQGHVPTIRRMLGEGATWAAIGSAIGWDPATAQQHYDRLELPPVEGAAKGPSNVVQLVHSTPAPSGPITEDVSPLVRATIAIAQERHDALLRHEASLRVELGVTVAARLRLALALQAATESPARGAELLDLRGALATTL